LSIERSVSLRDPQLRKILLQPPASGVCGRSLPDVEQAKQRNDAIKKLQEAGK